MTNQNQNADRSPPDQRANRGGWIAFATLCALVLVVAVGLMIAYGVPGTTGGTSQSQQQTSGAPQPKSDINSDQDRQTTGYGKGDAGK